MSLLYLECNMGAAGDMLAAALYELCTDAQKHEFLHAMQALKPHGVAFAPQAVTVCGIAATHMAVTVHGREEMAVDGAADGAGHDDVSSAPHAHSHDNAHSGAHRHPHEDTHAHAYPHCDNAAPHAPTHFHENEGGNAHTHDSAHIPAPHAHHHAAPAHIAALLDALCLPAPVREAAKAVYARIAQAESRAHGVPVSDIHFHEVGALDAVADVTAVCLLLHLLHPERVVVSPVATGSGTVRCAHGVLPVPAPATAYLLEGAPTWAGTERGELCTPTGAALLRQMATEFGAMPVMSVEKIGCGAGTKSFATANLVRAFWGQPMHAAQAFSAAMSNAAFTPAAQSALDTLGVSGTAGAQTSVTAHAMSSTAFPSIVSAVPAAPSAPSTGDSPTAHNALEKAAPPNETIVSLACNLDDATAEEIGFALGALLEAGALDAYTTPIGMKKNRAGTLLTVLCRPAAADRLAALLLHITPTLGVRRTDHPRYALARGLTEVDTPYGTLRVKTACGYGTSKAKPEYDDVAASAAHAHTSFAQVREAAIAAFYGGENDDA